MVGWHREHLYTLQGNTLLSIDRRPTTIVTIKEHNKYHIPNLDTDFCSHSQTQNHLESFGLSIE